LRKAFSSAVKVNSIFVAYHLVGRAVNQPFGIWIRGPSCGSV
jgi:hypothetical protein